MGSKPGSHKVTHAAADRPWAAPTDRIKLLEPREPNNPPPEDLAVRIVEAAGASTVSPAVMSLVAQLATAVDALSASERAVALSYITAAFANRRAG